MLTAFTKDTFIPRFPERGQTIRRPPCEPYRWDGAQCNFFESLDRQRTLQMEHVV
jgi:hypothetical protein